MPPTCNHSLLSGDSFRLRLWPVFSTAAFRRKLLETLICGTAHIKETSAARSPTSPPRDRDRPRSERLSELMKADASDSASDESLDRETTKKIQKLERLQSVANRLHNAVANNVAPEAAAEEVRSLAKDDAEARETLAMLGVIPPLVGMLDSGDPELHIPALYALLNLGIGNDLNKAAIVKAGAVHKMLSLTDLGSPTSDAIVANFLGLSALDSNKPIIGASGAIPFLIKRLKFNNVGSAQARQDALRAILNLSIAASNVGYLVESDLVPCLLSAVGDMDVSERVLSVVSNLVAAPEGRRAVSRAGDAFCILVDVLNWSDSPGCQEKAAYVLMLLAHKARGGDRAAMMEAGVMSALLELTLLGSALAQKRASRVLEILNLEKGKQLSEGFGGGVSAPICSPSDCKGVVDGDSGEEAGMSAERSAVRQLVKQSLQSNMRRIVRRANLPPDFAPSDHFKTLTATSTSKSLPF